MIHIIKYVNKVLEGFGEVLKGKIKSHLKMMTHLVFMITEVNLIVHGHSLVRAE